MNTAKNYPTTGVILASGEGSRLKEVSASLGVPKHLFPIGNTTIIERLIRDMAGVCQEILCITQKHHEELCLKMIQKNNYQIPVRIIAKTERGFGGDFLAMHHASCEHIALTMGDLIFPDKVVSGFIAKSQDSRSKAILALDSTTIHVPRFPTIVDFRVVMAAFPKPFLQEIIGLNPESLRSMGWAVLRYLAKGQIRLSFLKTLFNVNTPQAYQQALAFFQDQNFKPS